MSKTLKSPVIYFKTLSDAPIAISFIWCWITFCKQVIFPDIWGWDVAIHSVAQLAPWQVQHQRREKNHTGYSFAKKTCIYAFYIYIYIWTFLHDLFLLLPPNWDIGPSEDWANLEANRLHAMLSHVHFLVRKSLNSRPVDHTIKQRFLTPFWEKRPKCEPTSGVKRSSSWRRCTTGSSVVGRCGSHVPKKLYLQHLWGPHWPGSWSGPYYWVSRSGKAFWCQYIISSLLDMSWISVGGGTTCGWAGWWADHCRSNSGNWYAILDILLASLVSLWVLGFEHPLMQEPVLIKAPHCKVCWIVAKSWQTCHVWHIANRMRIQRKHLRPNILCMILYAFCVFFE